MAGYFASLGSAFGMNSDQTQGAIGGGVGLAGIAMSAMGTMGGMNAASQEAKISEQEAGTEMAMNAQRRQMMILDNSRKKIEVGRNAQLAQARGKAAAVNQGGSAQGGQASSGYSGGQGQIAGEAGYNLENLNQDFQIGNKMFDLTDQLDQQKIAMAQVQSKAASSSGMTSLGGSLVQGAGTFAKLAMLV